MPRKEKGEIAKRKRGAPSIQGPKEKEAGLTRTQKKGRTTLKQGAKTTHYQKRELTKSQGKVKGRKPEHPGSKNSWRAIHPP